MSALVCSSCWNYYPAGLSHCPECRTSLMVAERAGIYGGGRLDFAAETTPGLYAVLEFMDSVTFLRAFLFLNAFTVALVLNLAHGSSRIAYGSMGTYLGDHYMALAETVATAGLLAWGVGTCVALFLCRFRTVQMVMTIGLVPLLAAQIFFAATKGTQLPGGLALVTQVAVLASLAYNLRNS